LPPRKNGNTVFAAPALGKGAMPASAGLPPQWALSHACTCVPLTGCFSTKVAAGAAGAGNACTVVARVTPLVAFLVAFCIL
jgi:hypothetical protein